MPGTRLKLAVLSALCASPDFSALSLAGAGSPRQRRDFLRWLDQSGVALYLLWQLRQTNQLSNVPAALCEALEKREESNRRRTAAMLSDFCNVSQSFRNRGIRHAMLKGLTLAPEFCPEPELRHQTDLEALISPEATGEARAAIFESGYCRERKRAAGEIHFSAPLKTMPSTDDDIYTTDYSKEIELHTSIWENTGLVPLKPPEDCLNRTRTREVRGIPFTSLAKEDAFLLHLLHAFRHALGSWARLSWFWEIDYFLARHAKDTDLWLATRNRGVGDPASRNALGLVLRLTNELFGRPIPRALEEWCVQTLPDRAERWVGTFGIRWALSDISGSKLILFVHKDFIGEKRLWVPYLWRRMIPFRGTPTLGETESADKETRLGFRIAQRLFEARRLAFHTRSMVSVTFDALRWKLGS